MSDNPFEEIEPTFDELAGNYNDDDAEYIDQLFAIVNAPPSPDEMPTEESTLPNVTIRTPNRMMNRSGKYTGPLESFLALPADPNRRSLMIWTNSANGLFVAGEKTALEVDMSQAFSVYPGGPVDFGAYTGAIWLRPAPDTAPATAWAYSISTVTE